jgi:predicted NBD/HSP70 family sugar kinase
VLVLSRGPGASPAARVLDQLRRGGVMLREDLVESTDLSAATVSRAVASLIEAGLARPRPEMGRLGATGRPTVPLQLDVRRHGVVGVHVGRVRTTVCVADVRGRVLESAVTSTPALPDIAAHVAAEVAALRPAGRTIMSLGLVGPWTDLGLDHDELARLLSDLVGLRIASADHITAAAAAEHAIGAQGASGPTAYVYARDTIGFAVAEESSVGTVVTRSSRLTHFPTGSRIACSCRAVGCLEATASDRAIAVRAQADDLVDVAEMSALHDAARAGSARVRAVLRDRAATLGRAAAFVRDMVGCDRVVLVGQAFTGFPHVRDALMQGFEQATTLGPARVDLGHHGDDLQAVAASTIALVPFFEDPLAHVRVP